MNNTAAMGSLRIAIVEDEMIIADTICVMLEQLGYTVCWHAARYGEAVNFLDQDQPDLLLLDIQIAGKLDGIDLAKLVQEQYNLPYIFITANADAATIERAKTVRPMAYLTKPITKNLVYSAIEIALNNYNEYRKPSAKATTDSLKNTSIFVKEGHAHRKLQYDEICYLESECNYVNIIGKGGTKVLVRNTLAELLEQLDPHLFIRVHRSYAVHIKHIELVLAEEIKIAGMLVPYGRSYKEELFEVLGLKE